MPRLKHRPFSSSITSSVISSSPWRRTTSSCCRPPSTGISSRTYFFPQEQGSGDLLVEHRASMTAFDRSLPHRAARAFAKLQAIDKRMPAYVEYIKTRPKPPKNLPRQISVYGQVKPVLDPNAFVRIIKTMEYERLKNAGAADSPEPQGPPGSKPS